jgi:hypothetical protein
MPLPSFKVVPTLAVPQVFTEFDSGHEIAWRCDGRQPRPDIAISIGELVVPDSLSERTERSPLDDGAITQGTNNRIPGLVAESKAGNAAGGATSVRLGGSGRC